MSAQVLRFPLERIHHAPPGPAQFLLYAWALTVIACSLMALWWAGPR